MKLMLQRMITEVIILYETGSALSSATDQHAAPEIHTNVAVVQDMRNVTKF